MPVVGMSHYYNAISVSKKSGKIPDRPTEIVVGSFGVCRITVRVNTRAAG